ncbi:MFS transporter [Agrobacterium tumefaciens]|uniref:MFS transporter n=1 Tax=Agrobacterium tumefaciens TaxID=358 RepID=UPI00287DC443|nr:MFS transporter [Agrobacterium tumefaciens]MDS7594237.1 MFS transporter [Agrobacterium tumefaciens]
MYNTAARLERLPVGRFQYKLLMMGGLGYMFEAWDAGIIAFLLPALRAQWQLTSLQVGYLASSTYVGFLIGALIAGAIGDRYGRKNVMLWALVLFCLASLAGAAVNDWHQFFALRVIGGIGMGAEAAIIAPFLSEFVGAKYRGRFTASLAAFFSFGFVISAVLGYLLVPTSDDGWRYALIVTSMPVMIVLWWRRGLTESPRWLESQGRHEEANEIVTAIEKDYTERGVALPPVVPAPQVASTPNTSLMANFKTLLSPRFLRITIMTWLLWVSVTFSIYAFMTWIPSLLVERGMTMTKSFSFSILIYAAQIPGYFTAAWLCEKIGRPYTIVLYMALAAVSALSLAFATGDTQVIALAMTLSFFINGVAAGEYAYTPEVFPTRIRATGVGTASAIGRIGGIAAPILVGAVYPIGGFAGVFGMTTVILFVGALSVLILGIPTKNRSLEEIEAEEFAASSK